MPDDTLRKIHVCKLLSHIAVTGRAHCQRQVAFLRIYIEIKFNGILVYIALAL